jgi:hypothetical protein
MSKYGNPKRQGKKIQLLFCRSASSISPGGLSNDNWKEIGLLQFWLLYISLQIMNHGFIFNTIFNSHMQLTNSKWIKKYQILLSSSNGTFPSELCITWEVTSHLQRIWLNKSGIMPGNHYFKSTLGNSNLSPELSKYNIFWWLFSFGWSLEKKTRHGYCFVFMSQKCTMYILFSILNLTYNHS